MKRITSEVFDSCRRRNNTINLVLLFERALGYEPPYAAREYLETIEALFPIQSRQAAVIAIAAVAYL